MIEKNTPLVGSFRSASLDYNDYVENNLTDMEIEKELINARKKIDLSDELLIVSPFNNIKEIKSPIRELVAYALSKNKIVTLEHSLSLQSKLTYLHKK